MRTLALMCGLFVALSSTVYVAWSEEQATQACISNIERSSITLIDTIMDRENGQVPVVMPLAGQLSRCPKTGLNYWYQKVNDGGRTLEEGYGFKLTCRKRHFRWGIRPANIQCDLSNSRVIKALTK